MRSCRRTQHLHSTVTRHSNKLKKWKSSLCGLLISWLQIKEIIILKCCLLLLNNNEPFLNLIVRCGKKGFYTTGSDDQLTSWTEKKLEKMSQSQTCTKKVIVIVWWSASWLIHTAFWIPVKLLPLRSVLSKSMRCTEKCNAFSQYWSTERAQFFSTTMSDHTLHNQQPTL